ncbi:uncharacterized protein LOC122964932 [Acropora millepora]|uniref:uncharacterized protein LOC122964932 n=1 Tax=Acropora millepora TaxID=45264 RepID=UPI001CF15D56|nr:uncharacterized protein LOC122964932 [Acropora millepora]
MEILAGVNVQPTRPSPTTISHSLSLSPVLTTSVSTSIHSIETSTTSTLETRKAANPLPQTKKSPTRTVVPFSNPSTKIKETAVQSETGEEKRPIRDKRWQPKNETRYMNEALTQSSGVSPTPREPSITAAAGVMFLPYFGQDESMTYNFSQCTNISATDDGALAFSSSSHFLLSIIVTSVIVFGVLSFLFAKAIKRTRCIQGYYGRFLCQAERGTWRPRRPQSSDCCVLELLPSTTALNEDQIDKQAITTGALNSTETNDPASSSTRNTKISYLSEDAKSVCGVFPDVQCICLRSELLSVTSAHGSFDNTGGTLTHPDSDIYINIEPGTFLQGKQQPIFFQVIYSDTYVIRDIPEKNERTLISPVIKCGPHDINPQKAMKIVVPHCLYVDEVKKGSIAVYRCEQFTNEGPQNWKEIPSSSERFCHSKAWFSIKKDSIVIKTKVFSIWSIFICGVGGSKRKRVTAFVSKPNPASNLISLRCYIYSDNEDSKRKVKRFEEEHLKSACQFAVKPTAECSTRVEDFSCPLYFQQNGHTEDFIYVNPGIPLLPPQTISQDNGKSRNGGQGQHLFDQAATTDICANSSRFVIPEDLRGQFDESVTRQDCTRLCNHIVNDWKMILRHLGVEEAVLDNVDANHTRPNEKSYQGLLEWTRLAGTQRATIGNLCNALKAAGCTEAIEKLSSRDDGARLHGHASLETRF